MKFGALNLAGLLWLFPLMVLFYVWTDRGRDAVIKNFVHEGLLPEISGTLDMRKRKLKRFLQLCAILCILTGLMRPQWGFSWQEVKRRGLDIIIALDTSNSMLAEDVLPNRLDRSKLAIKDLVKKLQGDRIGLVAFSGTAFLQCPLTVDYNGFMLALDDITVNTIPVGGTSISNAIYTASKSFEGGKKKHKILIIITDGEDLEGGVDAAIARARAEGLTIYCVGIGTSEGELIPIRDEQGRMSFLKDQDGNVVKTHLDESILQKAALETGGIYVKTTGARFGLDVIYDTKLSKLEKEDFKSKMEKRYKERFQIPVLFALILLLLESLVGDRKKEPAAVNPRTVK